MYKTTFFAKQQKSVTLQKKLIKFKVILQETDL